MHALAPGTEMWAGASAALAAGSMLLGDQSGGEGGEGAGGVESGGEYAATLLETSRRLYQCAQEHHGGDGGPLLQQGLPEVLPQYKSWGWQDELAWAAAWLAAATGEAAYRDAFEPAMMIKDEDGGQKWW